MMGLFQRKPLLKVFVLVTHHEFTKDFDSLGMRKAVIEAVRPDVIVPEVPFAALTLADHEAQLEKGSREAVDKLHSPDFNKQEIHFILDKQIPLKIFEGEGDESIRSKYWDLARGKNSVDSSTFPEKLWPITERESKLLSSRDRITRARSLRKLVVEVARRASSHESKAEVLSASLSAFLYRLFHRQNHLVTNLLNAENYKGIDLNKPELKVMVSLGIDHETVLDALKRQVEEGKLKGFSGIKVNYLLADSKGHVKVDPETNARYASKLSLILKNRKYEVPDPSAQEIMSEHEQNERKSSSSRIARAVNKLAFWRRL